jgi:uncharacterized protein (TIGR03437 family)
VSFTVSGPATLSSSTVNTDATGKAQVTVQAGASAGTATVTASAGGFSQSFTLTVTPPAPPISTSNFYNAAGLAAGSISPCSLGALIATGLVQAGSGFSPVLVGPLAQQAGGIKISFNNVTAPIQSVGLVNGQEEAVFQVPCEVTPGGSVPVTVTVNGVGTTVNLQVFPASPGIFETVMSDNVRRAVAVRPDGSFVSLQNPARRGEIIRVQVTGMGQANPPIATNSLPPYGTDSVVTGQVIVGVNNSGVRTVSARYSPTQVGVEEVAFQVPADAATGNDIVLSVAVNPAQGGSTQFSNGSKLPIQ